METQFIEGFNNRYIINSWGEIYDCKRGKFIESYEITSKSKTAPKSYNVINLSSITGRKKPKISRLLAIHFIPNDNPLYTIIDHKDGISTNDSLLNLRWTNATGNNRNRTKGKNKTSQYMGVYLDKRNNKYIAQITIFNNKRQHLGSYTSELEAAQQYDRYAKFYGFDHYNFED